MICQIIEATTVVDSQSGPGIELILPNSNAAEIGAWPYPTYHRMYHLSRDIDKLMNKLKRHELD